MKNYVVENRTYSEFKDKVLANDEEIRGDEFVVFSYAVPNELIRKGVLPRSLPDEMMAALGAYFLTKRAEYNRFQHNFTFRTKQYLTCINGDIHGDFFVQQYNHLPTVSQLTLFGEGDLYKELTEKDKGKLYGHHDYWIEFLKQLVTFCCQEGLDVPYRKNWEEIFYGGKVPSDEPGEVSGFTISCLKNSPRFHKDNPDLMKNCIPRLPGWEEQRECGWIPNEGGIEESQGFISDGNLVYFHKNEEGEVGFARNRYRRANMVFTPDMVEQAIFGTISLIRDGAGRNQSQDPGLLMKNFPYSLYDKKV